MDGTFEKTVTHLLNWWSHVYMEGWCWEPCLWLMLFFFYSASNLGDYTWAIHHQCKQMFFNVLSRVNSRNFHNICDNVNSSLCWDFLHTLYSLLLDHWAVFSKEEHKTERRAKICPATLQHDQNLPLQTPLNLIYQCKSECWNQGQCPSVSKFAWHDQLQWGEKLCHKQWK